MSSFQFKQFTIQQSNCAMKVGTDGVLLGAWAEIHKTKKILDVGSGTGLISLMLAQRTPEAEITGIEIDKNAVEQSNENAQLSPWNDRVHFIQGDFTQYPFTEKFDLIVSNPPYFVDSLKNPDKGRETARHTDCLPPEKLAEQTTKLLTENGRFCVIYPTTEGKKFIQTALTFGLHCTRRTDVFPRKDLPVKRLLLEFTKTDSETIRETLIIEKEQRHNYTDEYIALTKDFYLKM